jgi:N-acyl-D-amino-acid deacylase
MGFDIIIKNGIIYDGSENPPLYLDIGITDGKILKMGAISDTASNPNTRIIDATGKIVCPGFIDMHSHDDWSIIQGISLECMVRQGITTAVVGNCGGTFAPLNPEKKEKFMKMFALSFLSFDNVVMPWLSFAEYLEFLEKADLPVNFIHLTGFSLIRANVLDYDDRTPSEEELEVMKQYMEEAMQAGSWGLSTGLYYVPQSFATTQEIIEVAKIVAKYEGFYFSHIRDEEKKYALAVQELIEIVEKSGCRGGQVSHLKPGRDVGGTPIPYLGLMEEANDRGLQIRGDRYPYLRSSNGLVNQLPHWAQEGGAIAILERLENHEMREKIRQEMMLINPNLDAWAQKIYIAEVDVEKWKSIEGLSLKAIADLHKIEDVFSIFFQIILDDQTKTSITVEFGNESDSRQILTHPLVMIGTDGAGEIFGVGKPHPRSYGTYPRILGKFVRDEKWLSLSAAIRKMTAFPAQTLGLQDRGMVKESAVADLVIFNPKTVSDRATFSDPHQYPEGIDFVIINGKMVIDDNEYVNRSAGKVLYKS